MFSFRTILLVLSVSVTLTGSATGSCEFEMPKCFAYSRLNEVIKMHSSFDVYLKGSLDRDTACRKECEDDNDWDEECKSVITKKYGAAEKEDEIITCILFKEKLNIEFDICTGGFEYRVFNVNEC